MRAMCWHSGVSYVAGFKLVAFGFSSSFCLFAAVNGFFPPERLPTFNNMDAKNDFAAHLDARTRNAFGECVEAPKSRDTILGIVYN